MINAHWYNRNEGRPYPVDDAASSVSDAGVRLPPGVLVDANLRWPEALGKFAFLSAVSVTPGLVTLTVQASDDPDAADDLVPLAVLSVRQPVDQGRMYAVKAQAPGVGGWVAFGSGTEQSYSGRFSTPAQSRLTTRAARPYRKMPIESLQAINAADRLTGMVTLKAESPLSLTKEERSIEGVLRDCIVVRLVDNNGAEGFPVPGDAAKISGYKQKSVFQEFAGPCAGRPEAGTCGCPEPIQFISAVPPDCEGVVTIEFSGCAELTLLEGCGAAVDCGVGLVDACLPPRIPDEDGLLPSEHEPANIPTPSPPPTPPPPGPNVEPSVPFAGLPLTNCFLSPGDVELDIVAGLWEWNEDDSPTTPCNEAVAVSESVSRYVPSGLAFLGVDNVTQGDWVGTYGELGYAAYYQAGDEISLPPGVTLSDGAGRYTWVTGTSDVRALQKPSNHSTRDAAIAYGDPVFVLSLPSPMLVSVYILDWDAAGRSQTMEILDAGTDAVLVPAVTQSSFSGGRYVTWRLGGNVKIRIIDVSALNSGASAIFFDPVPTEGVSASIGMTHTGSYATVSAANRCVAVWNLGDPSATFRTVTTEVKMLEGPAGVKHNAGIALNYRESTSIAGVFVYYVAEVDYDDQVFRISRFNGSVFTTIVEAPAVGLQLGEWYRITATVLPGTVDGSTQILARLTSVIGGLFDVNLDTEVTSYVPSTGTFGVCTNRALSRFGYIKIEEA